MAKTVFIAIPVQSNLLSHDEVVRLTKGYLDGFALNHQRPVKKELPSTEEAAISSAKPQGGDNQSLLIVTLEVVPNLQLQPNKKELWQNENIGAFVSFTFLNQEGEQQGDRQFFLPKFRKLTLLRDYILEPTANKLSDFLKLIEPKELHPLLRSLQDEIKDGTITFNQILQARNIIEDELVKKQKIIDGIWLAVDVITFSISYWIRKAFFPSDGFVTKTFNTEEIADIHTGLSRFWNSLKLTMKIPGDPKYPIAWWWERKRLRGREAAGQWDRNLEEYTANLLKDDIKFNVHGELKKHVVYDDTTQTYTITGTKQQIERLELFKDYSKHYKEQEIDDQNEPHGFAAMKTPIVISGKESDTLTGEGNTNFRPK